MLNLLTRTKPNADQNVGTSAPKPTRHDKRAARRERARVRAELASYRTDAERLDLDAMLSRHAGADLEPVQGISRQRS